jgi:hypothetical protein
MKTNSYLTLAFLAVAFLMPSVGANAADKPKYATDMPAGITAPAEVKTRLGTLKTIDGFPDKATIEKVYDNLDFQRGVQAVLTAMPAASLSAMRKGLRGFGPENQTVVFFEELMDSKTLFLTANTTSVYGFVWLNTKDGPLVIEAPPRALGAVDDFWFHWVGDIGPTGPDKGKGGKYLLLPPGYKGAVPEGYFVMRSKTYNHWWFFRGFLDKDGSPATSVAEVKKNLRIYPLAKKANPPKMNFVNGSGKYFNTIHSLDYSFYEEVNEVVQEEPVEASDPETLGLLASIGIEKGKPFKPDARMKKILTEAVAVGNITARAIAYRTRLKDSFFYENSAWGTPFIGGSYEFLKQKGVRNLDARSYFFFYATGITPAMAIKMVGKGSAYAAAFVDAKGDPLDGGKTYKIHLPPNIPAKEFWSFTLYDNQSRSMLQTDQEFPGIGSETKGIVANADKSFDVYFGPKAPAGKENNWIQTMPGKGYSVILRLYGPLDPWFKKTWRPGEIELVK